VPAVGWVALGWGEPVVPWWGGGGFVGRPWWGGWGGPRVVNNVVINRNTVVNVNNINVYQNMNVKNAMIATREDKFGRGLGERVRVGAVDPHKLEPIRGRLPVQPTAAGVSRRSGNARARAAAANPSTAPWSPAPRRTIRRRTRGRGSGPESRPPRRAGRAPRRMRPVLLRGRLSAVGGRSAPRRHHRRYGGARAPPTSQSARRAPTPANAPVGRAALRHAARRSGGTAEVRRANRR
jgi:hypothetical protein